MMAEYQERRFVCCICCPTTYTGGATEPRNLKEEGKRSQQLQEVLLPRQTQPTRHTSWEKTNISLQKPTMNNLLSFPAGNRVINIPLTISSKAHDFCISLLEDEDGSKFRDIENRHSKNGWKEINSEILEKWLQGSGQPVNW